MRPGSGPKPGAASLVESCYSKEVTKARFLYGQIYFFRKKLFDMGDVLYQHTNFVFAVKRTVWIT
jgi:hypothetical protein